MTFSCRLPSIILWLYLLSSYMSISSSSDNLRIVSNTSFLSRDSRILVNIRNHSHERSRAYFDQDDDVDTESSRTYSILMTYLLLYDFLFCMWCTHRHHVMNFLWNLAQRLFNPFTLRSIWSYIWFIIWFSSTSYVVGHSFLFRRFPVAAWFLSMST